MVHAMKPSGMLWYGDRAFRAVVLKVRDYKTRFLYTLRAYRADGSSWKTVVFSDSDWPRFVPQQQPVSQKS